MSASAARSAAASVAAVLRCRHAEVAVSTRPSANGPASTGSTTASTANAATPSTATDSMRDTTLLRNSVIDVTSASTRVTSSPGVRSRWKLRSAWSTYDARS